MPALSDAEILAVLPLEAKRKIDNAFEALSQSLPSDQERLILYRVAHTLKLNPTDTHFSLLAAMHYYLQLYQTIPDKIMKASDKEMGRHVHNLKSVAEREMAIARDRVIDELAQKVGSIAQQVAGNAATAEKSKAIAMAAKWATSAVLVCAVVFGGTGYVVRMAADQMNLNTAKTLLEEERTRSTTLIADAEKRAEQKIMDLQRSVGWVGTTDGQLAMKFFEEGDGKIAAKCTAETWDIKTIDNVKYCVPKLRSIFGKDGVYGWRIP